MLWLGYLWAIVACARVFLSGLDGRYRQRLGSTCNCGVRRRVKPMERANGDYELSDEKSRLDLATVHRLLSQTYWAANRSRKVQDQAIPYDGVDYALLRVDMRRLFEILVNSGINHETARQRLRSMEPFNRYSNLIREL